MIIANINIMIATVSKVAPALCPVVKRLPKFAPGSLFKVLAIINKMMDTMNDIMLIIKHIVCIFFPPLFLLYMD